MKRIIAILALVLTFVSLNAQRLYIFGGSNHDVYLGILNASKYDTESIWNTYGDYGSKYSTKSIWNKYGTYGGNYSEYSPFNKYATYPPVLVDEVGEFYGYLTVNKYKHNRADFKLANIICSFWESISEDVSDAYDQIFK